MARYVWDPQREKCVLRDKAPARDRRPVTVMRDQPGFHSPINGEWLEGRADIRRHEHEHGVTQVGNDVKPPAT